MAGPQSTHVLVLMGPGDTKTLRDHSVSTKSTVEALTFSVHQNDNGEHPVWVTTAHVHLLPRQPLLYRCSQDKEALEKGGGGGLFFLRSTHLLT